MTARNLKQGGEVPVTRNEAFGALTPLEKDMAESNGYPDVPELVPLLIGNPNWEVITNQVGFSLSYQPRDAKSFCILDFNFDAIN